MRDDDAVRAVVLYGGERVFAAGADIKEMSTMSYADMLSWGGRLQDALRAVARLPKPVVAAVTGYALGGGFELALTADFRVLGERAKVGVPEIQLGVVPGAGGTQRLPRLIGPARAKDLIFTGRHVGAEEALALGIADRVVPDAEVYEAALELAGQFAAGPALALRAAKQAVDDGLELDLDAGAAAGVAAVRGAVRHRGPAHRHAVVPRAGPGQGALLGAVSVTPLERVERRPAGNTAREGGPGLRVAEVYRGPDPGRHPRTRVRGGPARQS